MAAFPESITRVAYRSRGDELAWRREDVPAALAAIAASGHAVLGGEVWVVLGGGRWTGLVPDRDGGPDGAWTWDTKPRRQGEPWQDYCDRTARDSEQVVADFQAEAGAAPSVLGKLYFNFTYIPEPGSTSSAGPSSIANPNAVHKDRFG